MNSWDMSSNGRSQKCVHWSVKPLVSHKCFGGSPGILWSFSGNSSNTSCPRGKLGCRDGTSTHCQLSLHYRSSAKLMIKTMISIQSFPSSPCSHCSCSTLLQQLLRYRHFQFEEGGELRLPGTEVWYHLQPEKAKGRKMYIIQFSLPNRCYKTKKLLRTCFNEAATVGSRRVMGVS